MERRLELIKVLMKECIARLRNEEKFIEQINKIDTLYDVNFRIKDEDFIGQLTDWLGCKEEDFDKMYELFLGEEKEIDDVVEEFCKMYDI